MDNQIICYIISITLFLVSFPLSKYFSDLILKKDDRIYRNKRFTVYLAFFIRLLIGSFSLFLAFKISNINTLILLSSFGILSLLIPLTLQIPLQDLICGILIVVFGKFRIGDYIISEKSEGVVENISTFGTYVKTIKGTEYISNYDMWKGKVSNLFLSKNSTLEMSFVISNQNKLEKVENIITRFLSGFNVIDKSSIHLFIPSRSMVSPGGQEIQIICDITRESFVEFKNKIPKELYIYMQKNGIIFIDGFKPVSVNYKSNTFTPIILDQKSQMI
tara:strand:+ start:294 stop:1118 length:825 start_codon:yes stop_codon:yes gene_type:complete